MGEEWKWIRRLVLPWGGVIDPLQQLAGISERIGMQDPSRLACYSMNAVPGIDAHQVVFR